MKTKSKIALLAVGAFAIMAGFSLAFLPWKGPLEKRLQIMLEDKGFQHVRLTLSDLNLHSATLQNITIGEETPLTLKNLTIHYAPFELWNGSLRELAVGGLSLDMRQKDGRWMVQGLSSRPAGEKPGLPATPEAIAAIPFDSLTLDDSQMNLSTTAWTLSAPIEMNWNKAGSPEISLHSENSRFDGGKVQARAVKADINAKFGAQDQNWQGVWSLDDLQLETGDMAIPVMDGSGTVKAEADAITLVGEIKSGDKSRRAAFTLDFSLTDSQKNLLTVTHAVLPWHGGTLAIDNAAIPLTGKNPVRVTVRVERVSVDDFMQALTGKRVSATGIVSGDLPLTIGRDGSISFGQGSLKTDGPGIISLPADLIPGDNEQVALTREILKNFHYDGLSLVVIGGADGGLSVLVATEGKNPDVMGGRAVKLNIRLNGDLLDLVRQSAMFLVEPEKIFNQERP